MPVQGPGRRLMHHVGLEFVAHKVSGGGHRAVSAGLSLTSMIDFLVVTVVFLLITFSASGETPAAKGVKIPDAENTLDMIDAPIVAVVGSQILVDGTPSGNTRSVEESDRMQRIDELFNILKAKRELWKQTHPNKDFPGVAMLQIDENIKAVVVKSVFQTAAFAGFPNVSFMVNQIPKGGAH
jgi:biopolymer transport protein ExbD